MISGRFCGHSSQSDLSIIASVRARNCGYAGSGSDPSHRFWSVFMSGIGRVLFVLAFGGAINLTLGLARAAAPEWNAVRTHSVQIGPEANRLVGGFRATAG